MKGTRMDMGFQKTSIFISMDNRYCKKPHSMDAKALVALELTYP
jgi:hypothetical protein